MKLIDREMTAKTTDTVKGVHLPFSQASFNSHGCITVRNYNPSMPNNDVILCFNETETRAILDLFRKFKHNDIPF